MRLFLVLALLLAIPLQASQGPYTEEEDKRFKNLEAGVLSLQVPTNPNVDGTQAMKAVRYTYDFAVSGGSSLASIALDATIPANAIITRNYFYVTTSLTSSGSATLAFACGSANLLSAKAYNLFGGGGVATQLQEGVATGGTLAMTLPGSTSCIPTLTIGTANLTAGKVVGFIDYKISQ